MNDETRPDETERNEQIAEPKRSEQAEETQKPKPSSPAGLPDGPDGMSKLALLSIACLVAAFAVLVIYLKSGEASIPLAIEKMLLPAGAVVLGIALVAGVIALVMIKASGGALSGRRLALLGIIVPIVVGVAYVRSSSPIEEEPQVLPSSLCRSNISRLGTDMLAWAQANEGRLPAAGKWCDILLSEAKTDESMFKCPEAESGRCSYSLNKYAAEAGADLPDNMVLLFESAPGWNQVGGPELFIAPHESRRGSVGSVAFANGKTRVVSEEEIDSLNWKGEKESESEESESEESEDE